MIKTIIIDDEIANRSVLESFLTKYCPIIEVVGFAENADVAYQLILDEQPDLIFLDIKMPNKSGFDLLKMFDEINFNIIFLTAYDEYAIKAFDFNAIDYILKPIDSQKLIKSIAKVEKVIQLKINSNIIHFIHSIDEKNELFKSIALHKKDKVQIIDIDQISHIKAIRNYSEVTTIEEEKLISTKTLLEYEQLLSNNANFLRINKSVIINIRFVQEYTKGSNCFIFMKNSKEELEVSRRKKSEILQFLKNN